MYVGQTKCSLKLRISEHKAAIWNSNMDYAIARHNKERNDGSDPSDLLALKECNPIRKGALWLISSWEEAFWIYELNTTESYGLAQDLSSLLWYENINFYLSLR